MPSMQWLGQKAVWVGVRVVLVLVLSLLTWVVLKRQFPDAPLNEVETSVVVGVWLLIVETVKWALARKRRKRRPPAAPDQPAHKPSG